MVRGTIKVITGRYQRSMSNASLHDFQSGFRRNVSTETAPIRLMDQILFDLDNDKVTGLVFVDYKKAFDLIDTTCCYQTLS